eukprot:9572480-Ditylum_brightwellii.AAC.1
MEALKTTIYKDADISITAHLLTTIRKRKWLSDQPVATLNTACKGFSPFTVPELAEDTIDEINKQAEALAMATSTTAKEIREGMFQRPRVPQEDS